MSAAVTPERIMQFAWGYVPPIVIESAISHRVFDVLDEGPKNISEMQAATGAPERGLSAIMNVLVGLDLLAKDAQGVYSLMPESAAFLVRSKPSFQGGIYLHVTKDLIPRWLHLTEVVAEGGPAGAVNQQKPGSEFFQELVIDILPMSYPATQVLAEALQVKDATSPVRVLDIASGSGVWGIGLAQRSKQVKVTAVDWPDVLPVTRSTTEKFGVGDQFEYVAGDLADADFGTGYNVATLGHILHSEGEERSRSLLKKVADALAPGGTIIIAEFLVNADRTGPVSGLFFAVNMLVATDKGGTYSFEEIGQWLSEAGFGNARLLEAPGPSPLILADKL